MGITATFEALGASLAGDAVATVAADAVGSAVVDAAGSALVDAGVGAAVDAGAGAAIDAATAAEGFGGAGGVGVGGSTGIADIAGTANAAATAAEGFGGAGGVGVGGSNGLGDIAAASTDAAATAAEGFGGAGGVGVGGVEGLANNAGVAGLGGVAATAADATAAGTAATGTGLSSLLTPTNAVIASGLLGAGTGVLKSNAISDAQAQQTAAAAASQGVLNSTYNNSMGFQVPYQSAGANAINQIGSMSTGDYTQYDMNGNPTGTGTGSGYLQHQFNASDLAAGLAPNYDFMLQQGQNVNQRAANVGGGALSGNTLQGLQNYTQNYAGTAYQNAFTNYQQQRQNIYGNLAGIAGIGQAANTGAVGAANNYATNTTNLTTGLAQANAAATIGQAQNTGNTISNLGNTAVLASLLNQNNTVTA